MFLGLAKGQRRFGQADGPPDRTDQLGRRPRHQRVITRLQPVGKQLRRCQDVAQVMADLGHRPAHLRQPFLLPQGTCQLRLQGLQAFLGIAQFRDRSRRRNDPRPVFGSLGIGLHVLHHPTNGHHQQPLHGQKQQTRRKDRDDGRQDQDAKAVFQHRLAQAIGLQGDLDQFARISRGLADHPDHPCFGIGQHRHRIADQLISPGHPQVIGRMHRLRQGRVQHQLPHLVAPQNHVEHLGIGQEFAGQFRAYHFIGGGQQGKRGDLRFFQPQLQVILPEPSDRGDKDQHFGQHHKGDGQQQEAARERIQEPALCHPWSAIPRPVSGPPALDKPDNRLDPVILKQSGREIGPCGAFGKLG